MIGPAGTLFVDDGGAGRTPVVLVHSAAGTSAHWAAQLAHLRRSRRAVALDLRGHGRSEAPLNGDYSIEALAGDLGAVVDGLKLDRFVLVGHSLGGAVSVAYAGAHPERVAGLLLLDPAADGRLIPRDQAEGLMGALRSPAYQATVEAHWSSMLEESKSEVRERLLHDLRSTPRSALIGPLEALLTFDPTTPLSRYPGPQLSVITRLNETPAALHARVPALPHRKIEGTGHWVQLDAPEVVNGILDEFLRTVD